MVRAEGQRITFPITLVPAAGLIRGEDGTWMPVSDQAVRAFEAMTRGLEPFPAAKLEGVVAPEPPSAPASGPAPSISASNDGGSAIGWAAGAAGAMALGLVALLGIRRRRTVRRRGPRRAKAARPAEG